MRPAVQVHRQGGIRFTSAARRKARRDSTRAGCLRLAVYSRLAVASLSPGDIAISSCASFCWLFLHAQNLALQLPCALQRPFLALPAATGTHPFRMLDRNFLQPETSFGFRTPAPALPCSGPSLLLHFCRHFLAAQASLSPGGWPVKLIS